MNLSNLLFFATTLMQLFLLNRYCYALFQSTSKSGLYTTVSYTLSGTILYISSISFFPVIITGILSISSAFLISLCHKAPLESKSIFSALYLILGFISESFSYWLIYKLHIIPGTADLSSEETRLIILIISSFIMFLFIMLIKLFKKGQNIRLNKSHYMIMAFIILMSLFILNTLFFYTKNSISYFFSVIGVLCINILLIVLYGELIINYRIKNELRELKKQINYQNSSYQRVSNSFQTAKHVIHDTNKHLLYIRACILQKENEEAIQYINKTLNRFGDTYFPIATGNLIIDALLNNMLSVAKEKEIHVRYQINIGNIDGTDPFDLCIVIGNILDNAIEATQSVPMPNERNIHIRIFTTEHALTIYIKNSYIHNDKKIKTKKITEYHGIGLINVRLIADKYGGHLTTTAKERFETIVVLPYAINPNSSKICSSYLPENN